jgi:glycosyltransferase involved in cell wall biosynthesis
MHISFFDSRTHLRLQKQMASIRRAGNHRITFVTTDAKLAGRHWHGLCDRVIPIRLPFARRRAGRIVRRLFGGWLKRGDRVRLAGAVRSLDCDVLHVYGTSNRLAQVVIENARCPVVYDAYDFAGVRKGVENLSSAQRQAERFCLENADAMVTKFTDDVLDYFRTQGYRLPARILHHQDYCDDTSWLPIEDIRPRPRHWHLVQGGTIAPASAPREEFGYQQYHELVPLLASQGIHFHLYPNPASRLRQFRCYRKLDRREPYFHFHRPLPLGRFPREIRRFDWGAWIHPPWSSSLTDYYWYGIGNKLTVYAEAGLPLVVNRELRFGSRIVEENRIGVTFDFAHVDRLGDALDAADWNRLRRNLDAFRKEYSIGRQCHRLMAFYREVIG